MKKRKTLSGMHYFTEGLQNQSSCILVSSRSRDEEKYVPFSSFFFFCQMLENFVTLRRHRSRTASNLRYPCFSFFTCPCAFVVDPPSPFFFVPFRARPFAVNVVLRHVFEHTIRWKLYIHISGECIFCSLVGRCIARENWSYMKCHVCGTVAEYRKWRTEGGNKNKDHTVAAVIS